MRRIVFGTHRSIADVVRDALNRYIKQEPAASGSLPALVETESLESLLLARSPRFRALLEKSEKSIREGKGLSHQEFWKAVEERHKKNLGKT